MNILYAPWRDDYTNKTAHASTDNEGPDDCIFCKQFAENNDEKNFIIRRFDHHAVLLNRFPYNSGHLLIMPIKHKANLHDLSKTASEEFMFLITQTILLVQRILKTDGVNVGINLGKAAGAGLPTHLHAHVLPRWQGDTNFLPTLAKTKQISTGLDRVYKRLKPDFDALVVR